MSLLAALVCLA
jgi:histidine triad (HIT) family protein